jgi:transposase
MLKEGQSLKRYASDLTDELWALMRPMILPAQFQRGTQCL